LNCEGRVRSFRARFESIHYEPEFSLRTERLYQLPYAETYSLILVRRALAFIAPYLSSLELRRSETAK